MVFGLPEGGANKKLAEKISELFEELGEKPTRLGISGSSRSDKQRPVKVVLSGSTIVKQIMRKAKKVFLTPD